MFCVTKAKAEAKAKKRKRKSESEKAKAKKRKRKSESEKAKAKKRKQKSESEKSESESERENNQKTITKRNVQMNMNHTCPWMAQTGEGVLSVRDRTIFLNETIPLRAVHFPKCGSPQFDLSSPTCHNCIQCTFHVTHIYRNSKKSHVNVPTDKGGRRILPRA
jgi:hypothetical protein